MRAKVHKTVVAAATWASIAADVLTAVRRVIESLPQRTSEEKRP